MLTKSDRRFIAKTLVYVVGTLIMYLGTERSIMEFKVAKTALSKEMVRLAEEE